jgi:hypothetical protein
MPEMRSQNHRDPGRDIFIDYIMHEWCMKHGAGGKWYLDAKNYSDNLAEELHPEEYLTEQ